MGTRSMPMSVYTSSRPDGTGDRRYGRRVASEASEATIGAHAADKHAFGYKSTKSKEQYVYSATGRVWRLCICLVYIECEMLKQGTNKSRGTVSLKHV